MWCRGMVFTSLCSIKLEPPQFRTFCEELRLQCNVAGRLFISSLTDHALLLQLSTHDDHALLARLFSPMQGNEMIWGYRGHSWPVLINFTALEAQPKKKKTCREGGKKNPKIDICHVIFVSLFPLKSHSNKAPTHYLPTIPKSLCWLTLDGHLQKRASSGSSHVTADAAGFCTLTAGHM